MITIKIRIKNVFATNALSYTNCPFHPLLSPEQNIFRVIRCEN